jgi:hypothetical protein
MLILRTTTATTITATTITNTSTTPLPPPPPPLSPPPPSPPSPGDRLREWTVSRRLWALEREMNEMFVYYCQGGAIEGAVIDRAMKVNLTP